MLNCTNDFRHFRLEDVFGRIAEHNQDIARPRLCYLTLFQPHLTSLPADVLSGVECTHVDIVAPRLRHVSPLAFRKSADRLIFLNVTSGSFSDFDDFREAIRYLKNLNVLSFSGKINFLSAHAFEELIQLEELFLNGVQRSLARIDDFAFFELRKLRKLSLEGQAIEKVTKNTFSIEKSLLKFGFFDQDKLTIDLRDNLLNSESFEPGAFTTSRRPVLVKVGGNPGLTRLPEAVWKRFMDENPKNTVWFDGDRLECGCDVEWLFRGRNKYRNQIHYPRCRDGQMLFQKSKKDFEKCPGKDGGQPEVTFAGNRKDPLIGALNLFVKLLYFLFN